MADSTMQRKADSVLLTMFLQQLQTSSAWPCRLEVGEAPVPLSAAEVLNLRDSYLAAAYGVRMPRHCQSQHQDKDVCRAAQRDGVLCAEGECDIDEGVRAADGVASGGNLPRSNSAEARAAIEDVLAERHYPANTAAAGRAGWEAASRWLNSHGVEARAPTYRFLTPADTIQPGDEFVSDDYKAWEAAAGIMLGMRYGTAMKTMRRTTGVDQPDGGQR